MPNINDLEYSIFSQNGEDGIIAYLTGGLRQKRRRFVDIGTSDGGQNNTFYLLKKGWSGVGIDAVRANIERYAQRVAGTPLAAGLLLAAWKVDWQSCTAVIDQFQERTPDFFSLDIDSVDYYVAHRLLHEGFRPGVVCCEFNPFLGSAPLTVVYDDQFSRYGYDKERGLYFGVAIAAWKHLFGRFGYRFCGVESAGVNAFFCLEDAFEPGFLDGVSGLSTAYSTVFVKKYGLAGEQLEQELLARKDLVFVDVTKEDVAALAGKSAAKPGAQASARAATAPAGQPRIHAVATFHAQGYEQFGKRFIESFRRHWPKETKLWIMAEGCAPEGCDRVLVRDLMADARDLVEFKERHAKNPGAHGRFGKEYDYMHDAVRWSHRIFALREAAERSDADILINMDADIVCFEDMPLDFLATLMPAEADIGYMPRERTYSECSFVLYRISRLPVLEFIWRHTDFYTEDKIFGLPYWTDCHPFDAMVAEHKQAGDLAFFNINQGVPSSLHPFINGPLGRYMDHLKGGRKETGRSHDRDLVVARTEQYWKKNTAAGDGT